MRERGGGCKILEKDDDAEREERKNQMTPMWKKDLSKNNHRGNDDYTTDRDESDKSKDDDSNSNDNYGNNDNNSTNDANNSDDICFKSTSHKLI